MPKARSRLLKYVLTPELRGKLPGIARLLSKVIEEPDGGGCVMAVLHYLGSTVAAETIRPEELLRVVQSHMSPQGNKIMPTIAEVWIQEGFEKGIERGIEKGIERGKLLGAIHLLEELLNKPLSDIETLKQMTLEQLAERVQALRDEQAG